jgi:hypothetical protein
MFRAREGGPRPNAVLNSNNAIGEKSSVTACCSVFARRDGHVPSMRSPLIVGIELLRQSCFSPFRYSP